MAPGRNSLTTGRVVVMVVVVAVVMVVVAATAAVVALVTEAVVALVTEAVAEVGRLPPLPLPLPRRHQDQVVARVVAPAVDRGAADRFLRAHRDPVPVGPEARAAAALRAAPEAKTRTR